MTVSFADSGPPTTNAALDAIELRTGVTIPVAYREFLLRNNGGRPSPDSFNVPRPSGGHSEHWFVWMFMVNPGHGEDLEAYIDRFKIFRKLLPEDLVPIGRESRSDLICISNGADDAGVVYFWDGESVIRLADNLDAFLAILYE